MKEAFETIYHRYKYKLFYFSYGYLHSKSDAEEIIQEVFISLWEHRQTLRQELSVKSYLYKSTINSIYNYFKHKSVQQKYIDKSVQNNSATEDHQDSTVNFNELRDVIETLIGKLPDRQQQVFKMSRWEGMSHEEISKALGISVRTVENQVHRAIKYIKDNLKEEYMMGVLFLGFVYNSFI
jgi:RNA polymerase sigma-70 factor (ECF subfamily)